MLTRNEAGPFVGRDVEARHVEACLDAVTRGRGSSLVISGEPGIGKTRLLEEAAAEAVRHGVHTVRGSGRPLEQDRPFSIASELTGLPLAAIPDLDAGEGARFRAADLFLDELEARFVGAHHLVLIDDAQWADPGSILVIDRLLETTRTLPVAVIVAMRPAPVRPELAQLLDRAAARGTRVILLGPLDETAAGRLAAAILGGAPGADLARHLALAAGNPLFLRELLIGLAEEGAIDMSTGVPDTATAAAPRSLRMLLLGRVAALAPESAQLLRAASVLGSPFHVHELAAVTGLPALQIDSRLFQAIRLGLLEPVGEELVFRHDLLSEAIYDDIPEGVRRTMHHEFALALADLDGDPVRIAAHIVRGSPPGDHAAIKWLDRVGTAALAREPAVAVSILSHGVALAGSRHPRRSHLMTAHLQALCWSGRRDEVLATSEEYLRDLPADEEIPIRLWRLRSIFAGAHRGAGPAEVEAVLRLVPSAPPVLRAELVAESSYVLHVAGDLTGSDALARQAMALGTASGNTLAVARGLGALVQTTLLTGNYSETAASAERLERLLPEIGSDGTRYALDVTVAMGSLVSGRILHAVAVVERAIRESERIGTLWLLPQHYANFAVWSFIAGRWDDVLVGHDAGVAVTTELGISSMAGMSAAHAAAVLVDRDDLASAGAVLDGMPHRPGPFPAPQLQWARALLHEAAGDLEAARASIRLAVEEATNGVAGRTLGWMVAMDAARLCRDTDQATTTAAKELLSEPAANSVEARFPSGWIVRGFAERDAPLLLKAVDELESSHLLCQVPEAREEAAAILAADGHHEPAIHLLRSALAGYRDRGSVRGPTRVAAALRSLGVRDGATGPRRRSAVGWESLTATEQRVLDLVREGHTNGEIAHRLYVSKRTIESHVSSILRKVSARNRGELIAMAARRHR